MEDAVAPQDKAKARTELIHAAESGWFHSKRCILRVNSPRSSPEWFREDCFLAKRVAKYLTGIAWPKAEKGDTETWIEPLLLELCKEKKTHGQTTTTIDKSFGTSLGTQEVRILPETSSTRLMEAWAFIETASGICDARDICASCTAEGDRVFSAVSIGYNDLLAELRVPTVKSAHEATKLFMRKHAASQVVLAARASGIPAYDGVFNDIKDLDGLRDDALNGRRLGFAGKSVIHPTHLDIVRDAFAPTEQEVQWAKCVVDAFTKAQSDGTSIGVVAIDGQMIEQLHVDRAFEILHQQDEQLIASHVKERFQ